MNLIESKRSKSTFGLLFALVVVLNAYLIHAQSVVAQEPVDASETLVLAHFMPWYVAKPHSAQWGWHWTMAAFDPDKVSDGKPEIASHFHPLIGPYDSGDEYVLEYQLLTMKLAGIDGVIVDWYGLTNLYDYSTLHQNTQRLVKQCERLKMKFAVCYEDQTIGALQKAGRITSEQRVIHAAKEIDWLADHWFTSEQYVRDGELPVLLSFGFDGLKNNEWTQCLKKTKASVTYISQHHPRAAAAGAFDWPNPSDGVAATIDFRKRQAAWSISIPVALPRFVDIYAQAKVRKSYGRIEDKDGETFRETLARALESKRPFVQIATWNDWGEGTQIEPSHEFGYRDLETLLKLRSKVPDREYERRVKDLRLPARLLERRRNDRDENQKSLLDKIATLLADGSTSRANESLAEVFPIENTQPAGTQKQK